MSPQGIKVNYRRRRQALHFVTDILIPGRNLEGGNCGLWWEINPPHGKKLSSIASRLPEVCLESRLSQVLLPNSLKNKEDCLIPEDFPDQ
jgi:hypothetical protein